MLRSWGDYTIGGAVLGSIPLIYCLDRVAHKRKVLIPLAVVFSLAASVVTIPAVLVGGGIYELVHSQKFGKMM
jgi:hypothetical protein